MRWIRLLIMFAVHMFLVFAGHVMYSNDKVITGNVMFSIVFIAFIATVVTMPIWDYENLARTVRRIFGIQTEKQKRHLTNDNMAVNTTYQDDLQSIQQRLERLENNARINHLADDNTPYTHEQVEPVKNHRTP